MVIIGVWYVHGGLLYYFLYFYVYLKVSVKKSEKKNLSSCTKIWNKLAHTIMIFMIYTYHKQNNILP